MVELTYIDVSFLTEEKLNIMLSRLSDYRKKKAEAYLNEKDRRLSIAVGYLLDCALSKRGLSERDVKIVFGEHGKPYIEVEKVFFNLSHSGNLAVCALSDSEVGVDVQAITAVSQKVIERVCTKNEYESIKNSLQDFVRLWTVKESVVKYLGEGLSRPLNSVECELGDPTRVKIDGVDSGLFIKEYAVDGYRIAVALGVQPSLLIAESVD